MHNIGGFHHIYILPSKAKAKYRYIVYLHSEGCFICYIVHCHGNNFLNPEIWGSKSGCHGNILYSVLTSLTQCS